jgi:hypothetical protein
MRGGSLTFAPFAVTQKPKSAVFSPHSSALVFPMPIAEQAKKLP